METIDTKSLYSSLYTHIKNFHKGIMTESAKKFETIKRDTNQALKFSDMIKTVLQTALETDKLNTETINTMICHSEDFQGKFHSQLNKLKSDLNELNAKLINQSNIRYNNNVS